MENKGINNTEELKIQGLLDRYLTRQSVVKSPVIENNHLDEDSLTAFVEGNLSQRESKPIVSHLVDCSFCRHVTAELVRLDLTFADAPVFSVAEEKQSSKVAEVLSGVLARIFGTNERAVFAHQEEEKEAEKNSVDEKKE